MPPFYGNQASPELGTRSYTLYEAYCQFNPREKGSINPILALGGEGHRVQADIELILLEEHLNNYGQTS